MTTEMVRAPQAPTHALALRNALQPQTIDEAFRLATALCKGGKLGQGLNTPEAVMTVVIMGAEIGLTMMQAITSIYVFSGRPTIAAKALVALVKRSPACKSFRLVETSDERATYATERVGEEGVTKLTYTISQAKQAGLVNKDNWKHHPAEMLRARASAALCHAVYPDVTLGIYAREEIEDEPSLAGEGAAPHRITTEQLQARVVGADESKPEAAPITDEEIEAALRAAKDADALRANAKNLQHEHPKARTRIKAAFDRIVAERKAAAAAAKAEPKPDDPKDVERGESDGEPPADVKLDGEDVPPADRGDAYEGPQ